MSSQRTKKIIRRKKVRESRRCKTYTPSGQRFYTYGQRYRRKYDKISYWLYNVKVK